MRGVGCCCCRCGGSCYKDSSDCVDAPSSDGRCVRGKLYFGSAFSLVSNVVTPSLGTDVSQAGALFKLIGNPIAWGLCVLRSLPSRMAAALAPDSAPRAHVRARRALASDNWGVA